MADGLLQDSYGLAVGGGDEGDDHAVGPGPAGSPGPVHVVLRRRGQVEVDDAADVVDVDPPGRDVGGDERLGLPGDERPQCPVALGLGPAAVERDGADAGGDQLAGDPVGAVLRPAEHDGRAVRGDEVGGEARRGPRAGRPPNDASSSTAALRPRPTP